MVLYDLSPEEEELIFSIRNLVKAYPNGYHELLYHAQQLFDDMVDLPK